MRGGASGCRLGDANKMDYPNEAGYFDKSELIRLSLCLGYPGKMLINGLKASSLPRIQSACCKLTSNQMPVSSKLILELLDQRHMHQALERLFNNHSVQYNQKVFKKAMVLLGNHQMCFTELYEVRLSYELYSVDNGGGMKASTGAVLLALKMLERVMSPIQLEYEIKRQQTIADLPPDIQLYEFMDIVVKSTLYSDVEKELLKHSETKSICEGDELSISDFDKILMSKDEHFLTHLDKKYKASLFKEIKPKSPSTQFSRKQFVSSTRRRDISAVAHKQIRALMPALEISQQQAHQARNGFFVFSPGQHKEVESRCATGQCSKTREKNYLCSPTSQEEPRHHKGKK